MGSALAPVSAPVSTETSLAQSRGDEASMQRALYRRHARYVAGVVYRLLGNDSDLEDIVQETFIAAFEGIHRLSDPSAVRPWLVTIAVRHVRRVLAQRRRRRFFFFQAAEMSARSSDPRDLEPIDDLADALQRLPADLRIPWVLARVEHVTLPEVAKLCDVSLATVKRKISDADERIERRIKRRLSP